MSWIAEYDTQGREFPTCVHVTKTTGTMTHGATYVPIEEGKAVRAENAKLRELAAILCNCMRIKASCDDCRISGHKGELVRDPLCACDGLHEMLRELGIEVDG